MRGDLVRVAADVRRVDHAAVFDERMIGAGRLDRERVERRTREMTRVERGDERRLVDQRRARC